MDETSNPSKDTALDGLRGLASLVVVLSHCFFGFFPYTHTGDPAQLRFGWEETLFNSPFYFLYSGGFAVSVFFVLSGFVLSKKFFAGADIGYLRSAAYKRYFRLGLPVLAAVMFGYLMVTFKAFPEVPTSLPVSFAWKFYRSTPSFLEALSQGLYGSLLFGRSTYDYVLWTIQIEFFGSLFLFALLALFGRNRFGGVIALLAALFLFSVAQDRGGYFAMFIIGAYINCLPRRLRTPAFTLPALLAGLFLGAYKSNAAIYVPLVVAANTVGPALGLTWSWPVVYEAIAAGLVVSSVLLSPLAHRVLSHPVIWWTGKASFSIYLIHTLILGSVGLSLYRHAADHFGYELSAFMAIAVVFTVTLALAELFRRAFDTTAVRFSNRIAARLSYASSPAGDRVVAPSEADEQYPLAPIKSVGNQPHRH